MSGTAVAGAEGAERVRRLKQAALVWLLIAVLNFGSQLVLRWNLAPGEFGTVNTILGIVAVLAAPLLALDLYFAQRAQASPETEEARAARPVMVETAALGWGGISLVLLFLLLPLLALPRVPLQFFAVLTVGAALISVCSGSICATENRARLWTGLLIGAAAVRFGASAGFASFAPWAQAGLAAVLVAGLVTAFPALRGQTAGGPARSAAWSRVRAEGFFVPLLATVSVLVAVALFTNADRIVAQSEFGTPAPDRMGYVDLPLFDDYQMAGLLGRGLLWGTLPLLLLFLRNRAALDRTTTASLRIFWVYLVLLFGGDIFLVLLGAGLDSFAPHASTVAALLPGFAGAMLMLGLLQGIAIFVLASRRYLECFVVGGCSVAYALGLFFFGRQPQLMTASMFYGALTSLTAVLFVGVTRYARHHP